jgi:hypothetical protein
MKAKRMFVYNLWLHEYVHRGRERGSSLKQVNFFLLVIFFSKHAKTTMEPVFHNYTTTSGFSTT